MKKIISLLMIMSIMILSIGTAFAWSTETVTTGLNIVAEEDSTGLITVTVSANDTTAIQGVTVYLDLSGVKAVKASDKKTEATAYSDVVVVNSDLVPDGWAATAGSLSSSKFKAVVGSATAKVLTNQEIFKAYFVKTGASITTSAFELGTTNAKNSKISYTGGKQKQTKTASEQAYFGLKVVPYSKPVVDKWEAATSTDMSSAWTAPDALDGEVRRVTVFGKNATSKALAANSYGVTFGDNTYYGIATDTAVQYWAIVIVDTEGNKITSGTYNGTAFVGTETWNVSVSAD